MSKKRAKLPGADVLFGDPQTVKQQNISTLKYQDVSQSEHQDVKTEKKQNIMVTLYFLPETIKEIEKAKVKLLIDYDLKTTKSQMVEEAVKNALQNLDLLFSLLSKKTD